MLAKSIDLGVSLLVCEPWDERFHRPSVTRRAVWVWKRIDRSLTRRTQVIDLTTVVRTSRLWLLTVHQSPARGYKAEANLSPPRPAGESRLFPIADLFTAHFSWIAHGFWCPLANPWNLCPPCSAKSTIWPFSTSTPSICECVSCIFDSCAQYGGMSVN